MRRAELRRAAVSRRWAHGTTTSIKSREWSNGELRPVQGPGSAHEAACEREALEQDRWDAAQEAAEEAFEHFERVLSEASAFC
jgi:hypothetical protein